MQHSEVPSTHRKSPRYSDNQGRHQDFGNQLPPQVYPVSIHGPYFPNIPSNQYYIEPNRHEPQPYLLPYAPFQQSQPAGHIHYQPVNIHEPRSQISGVSYHQHTPPLKRPRTEVRHVMDASPPCNSLRNVTNFAKSTPSRTTTPRKTFSDFRISRVKIGSWVSEESKEEHDTRDSKIRFCFRNQNDREVPSTLSASEAALVMPDRVSISVLKGTQRIIIPAYHIKSVEFRRNSGQITIFTDGWAAFEASQSDTKAPGMPSASPNVGHIPNVQWNLTEDDLTQGELSKARKIEIQLDMQKPLTEPKWTRGNLAEYIDSSSRFSSIIHILDAKPPSSIESFFDQWVGDDAEKTYFYKRQMSSDKFLEMIIELMSTSNILTPAITTVLRGMIDMIAHSETPEAEVVELMKSSLFLIPSHMLSKSIDALYSSYLASQRSSLNQASPRQIELSFAGSKRQRGESEVPSDQLAKTTLDEKRRRLSDSEPQLATPRRAHSGQRARIKSNLSDYHRSVEMAISKSEEFPSSSLLPMGSEHKCRTRSEGSSSAGDGQRLSREELLRELEDQEGQDSSSDQAPEEGPIEATSLSAD